MRSGYSAEAVSLPALTIRRSQFAGSKIRFSPRSSPYLRSSAEPIAGPKGMAATSRFIYSFTSVITFTIVSIYLTVRNLSFDKNSTSATSIIVSPIAGGY
jgi:hypothetical protein